MTRKRAAHSPVKSVGAVIVGTSCQCAHSAIQGITLLLHTFFFFFSMFVFLLYDHGANNCGTAAVNTSSSQGFDCAFSRRYHMNCLASSSTTEPEDDWVCPECADVPPNRGIVMHVMRQIIQICFFFPKQNKTHYFVSGRLDLVTLR